MVPKLKQKFQSETDVPDVGKVPEITLKPRDGTLSYLLLRSSSLAQPETYVPSKFLSPTKSKPVQLELKIPLKEQREINRQAR